MKRINKTNGPTSLIEYRSSIKSSDMLNENIYNDYAFKTKEGCEADENSNLRKQLLEEQGYICCYCMSRISCTNSKIEHFKPQSKYRDLQIDYNNLFAACCGNEGQKKEYQHCDTKKAETKLSDIFNLLSDIENIVDYKKNDDSSRGIVIYSEKKDIQEDIKTLNLNTNTLKKIRLEAYTNLISKLKNKSFNVANIKKLIAQYQNKTNGKFEPFCQMLVYFLKKKLQSKGAAT